MPRMFGGIILNGLDRCIMAFCDLKPVRVYDEASGCTFIIGDTFSVFPFGTDRPSVFSWDMIGSVIQGKKDITFKTENSDYRINLTCFTVRQDYFRAIAIIESMKRSYDFSYTHEKRVLPLKHHYIEVSAGNEAYIGEALIDENDTAAAFVTMMNIKLIKVLWLIAILVILGVFAVLHFFIGSTSENILYFIPISIAVGGIITLLIYLVSHAVAKNRFQHTAGADPAAEEIITFVISPNGFAACESCIYDQQDIIPWRVLDHYIETDKLFIFYRGGEAIVYMPKKAFDKKHLGGISDIIAINVEQK